MIPYFVLLIFIIGMTFFDGNKIDKILFIITSIWMFFFSALREGGTGSGDYEEYLKIYSKIYSWEKVINPDVHTEMGFRIMSFLGNYLEFPGQFIIVVMAILSFFPVAITIYKYSPYKILSLLVWMPYFLTMNMHSSRISVAAAFGLLFFISFINRSFKASLLYFLLALSFHTSSLVLISVLLLKIDYRYIHKILLFSFIVFIFISPFDILIEVSKILGGDKVATFIQIYVLSEEYGYPMPIYDYRILLGIGVVFLILNIKQNKQTNFEKYIYKIYLLGVFFIILFSGVTIMAWRVSYYFLLSSVIVIPYLSKKYNIKIKREIGTKRLMNILFLSLYVLYSIPLIIRSQPYKFVL